MTKIPTFLGSITFVPHDLDPFIDGSDAYQYHDDLFPGLFGEVRVCKENRCSDENVVLDARKVGNHPVEK